MTTERERFEAWLAQFRELAPLHGPVLWEAWQAAVSRAQPAAPADAAPSVAPEPVAWTLQSELDAAQTTCSAHLWFTNPRNSAWTALFTREQIAAHPPRAPLTEEHVTAVVRSVCPNLAETSKAWRDLVVECRYWLEAAHGIGGK